MSICNYMLGYSDITNCYKCSDNPNHLVLTYKELIAEGHRLLDIVEYNLQTIIEGTKQCHQ